MNYTKTLKKAEALLLWVYWNIANKFEGVYSILKELSPVLNRYPLLKYSVIPLLIALFFALRYILKFVINELAAWASGFAKETSCLCYSRKHNCSVHCSGVYHPENWI